MRSCDSNCEWGGWVATSACTGGGECAAGDVQPTEFPCGDCPVGSQSASRTCDINCSWGTWGNWGACIGGGNGCNGGEYCCADYQCIPWNMICGL